MRISDWSSDVCSADLVGIHELDLSGKRVLDIAANDGFWTFWAESRGAEDLLAIDIDGFKEYDWGWDGSPDDFNTEGGTSNWTDAGAGFYELSRILGSKAKREHKSIYDLAPKGEIGRSTRLNSSH